MSLSHEVVGTFREYERAATTEIDAALSPLLAGYLRRLVDSAREADLPEPAIMQSNGGLIDVDAAAGHAAWTVLSGPAGGAAGAAFVARAAGTPDALCFDMGGTSCDVCVIEDGAVQERGSGEIAGRPLALPMLAIHTVGAGGGSIAWRDAGGALRVGPRSAGADPGPACYGRGGTEPTVTDANLVLGLLASDAPLAGGVELDLDAARDAVGTLADELGLDLLDCAEGIRRVAGAEMIRALRVVTVQRGIDPRRFALLPFGGAGPLHATQIADELGIETIVCPRASGVLSARRAGRVRSPPRRPAKRAAGRRRADRRGRSQAVTELGERARERARRGRRRAKRHLRAALPRAGVRAGRIARRPKPEPEQLREAFEAQHEDRYGYSDPEQTLELVTIRVTATLPGADVTLAATGDDADVDRGTREATIGGEQVELEVLRGAPSPGTEINGPAAIDLPESTLIVPAEWSGSVDDTGTIHLDRNA